MVEKLVEKVVEKPDPTQAAHVAELTQSLATTQAELTLLKTKRKDLLHYEQERDRLQREAGDIKNEGVSTCGGWRMPWARMLARSSCQARASALSSVGAGNWLQMGVSAPGQRQLGERGSRSRKVRVFNSPEGRPGRGGVSGVGSVAMGITSFAVGYLVGGSRGKDEVPATHRVDRCLGRATRSRVRRRSRPRSGVLNAQ